MKTFDGETTRRSVIGGAGALLLTGAGGVRRARAQAKTKMNVMALPTHPGFTLWAARDLGFFSEEGLDVPPITYFPSGPAAIAAGYAGAWDCGYLGGPPTISAGVKYGLLVAGLNNIQMSLYEVFVRKGAEGADDLAAYLPGKTALTAVGSNMQYFLNACLNTHGVDPSEVRMVNVKPPNIPSAAEGGQGEIVSTWYPFNKAVENTGEFRSICNTNKDVGINTYDFYVIRPTFAEENPEAAVGFLRAVYRVNDMIREDLESALPLVEKYYNEIGVKLAPEYIPGGFDGAVYPSMKEALERMKSGEVKATLESTSEFLVDIGSLDAKPDVNFITTEYLEKASA